MNFRRALAHHGNRLHIRGFISFDPEEIRSEASRVEDVGDLLGVNTDNAQETLREAADEIEREREDNPKWDSDDDSRGGGGASDYCSDSELDSMFGTLN